MPELFHIVRLGTHAERDYLARTPDWFEGLIVNANLVEATKAATAAFVVTLGKPYFIDPVTYAFALDPHLLHADRPDTLGQPRVKSTFTALANSYQLPLGDTLGRRSLEPGDFDRPDVVRGVVEAVLDYQRRTLPSALAANADFVTAGGAVAALAEPAALMPPYLVEDGSQEVRATNQAFMETAEDLVGAERLSPVFAYDSRQMDEQAVLGLADSFGTNATRVWLWPTDLDEHNSSQASLSAYADLVVALAERGRHPTASYGGYFAILLSFRGMRGLSHGVGYGDKRDLEPVLGGGLPPPRYYFRPVRDGIGMGELALALHDLSERQFLEQICGCTICRGLIARGGVANLIASFNETEPRQTVRRGVVEVPTARVYRMARFHYLENRRLEIGEMEAARSWEEVAAPLATQAAWAAERFGRRAVGHINRWIEAARPNRA